MNAKKYDKLVHFFDKECLVGEYVTLSASETTDRVVTFNESMFTPVAASKMKEKDLERLGLTERGEDGGKEEMDEREETEDGWTRREKDKRQEDKRKTKIVTKVEKKGEKRKTECEKEKKRTEKRSK